MDIRFQAGGPSLWKGATLLTFACKGENPVDLALQGEQDYLTQCASWFTIAPGLADFKGKKKEIALFHGHPEQAVPRVLSVGMGEREQFCLDTFREGIASALSRCRSLGIQSVLVPLPALMALPADTVRLVEETSFAAFLGLYTFTKISHKASAEKEEVRKEDDDKDPDWLAFAFMEESVPDSFHAAARRGQYGAEGVCLARDLANAPPNIMTPRALSEKAHEVAKKHGMAFSVLGEEALKELGCGAMLAVGQGSHQETCMVILEYAPKGHENDDPLIFVGKGLTFDSGGISLKPSLNMHIMKSDMSGAAAVLGAIHCAGQLHLERRIVAIMACAENMPDGMAMRPGDVVTSFSGKTVEIINTDAEGRLVLCDALSYAQKHWTPAYMVDIATLTGACAVALGQDIAGLFSDDVHLAAEIESIGAVVGEPFWRLPLWKPYKEHLKSTVADISHMGPREGGAINAAMFLKDFVDEKTPWAHLDIAGTDWAFKSTSLSPVGALGFGVRTLVELMRGAKL